MLPLISSIYFKTILSAHMPHKVHDANSTIPWFICWPLVNQIYYSKEFFSLHGNFRWHNNIYILGNPTQQLTIQSNISIGKWSAHRDSSLPCMPSKQIVPYMALRHFSRSQDSCWKQFPLPKNKTQFPFVFLLLRELPIVQSQWTSCFNALVTY